MKELHDNIWNWNICAGRVAVTMRSCIMHDHTELNRIANYSELALLHYETHMNERNIELRWRKLLRNFLDIYGKGVTFCHNLDCWFDNSAFVFVRREEDRVR